MRIFAAVLPPEEVTAELAVAVDGLKALPGAERLRWTERAGWHLTLAFYGEVPEHILPGLHERLERAAAKSSADRPLGLRLSGGGRFGDRALWAGVDGDREALGRLAERAAAAGRRSGIEREEARRFRAHLTLARTSRGDAPHVDLRGYVAALESFSSSPWKVGALTLVRSHLPVSGVPGEQPRYEPVAAWPLGGATGAG